MSSNYGNSPTTVLDHLRMEFWFLVHPKEYASGGIIQWRGPRCHGPAGRRQRTGSANFALDHGLASQDFRGRANPSRLGWVTPRCND
jgi:hypothetical protein